VQCSRMRRGIFAPVQWQYELLSIGEKGTEVAPTSLSALNIVGDGIDYMTLSIIFLLEAILTEQPVPFLS